MMRSGRPSWPKRLRRETSAAGPKRASEKRKDRKLTIPAPPSQQVDYKEAEAALKNSIAGRIGSSLTAVSAVNGFDWRTNVALLSGFAAKEVIISTMGTAYSLGQSRRGEKIPLSGRLAADASWTPLKAFSLIIFIMLYAPCFATIACIIHESSWKWGLFSLIFNTTIAFLLSALVYRGGLLLGLG